MGSKGRASAPAGGSGSNAASSQAAGLQAASSYLTLRAGEEATAEFVDRKSRFIAQLVHVESEGEANEFISSVRARHYDARHNVPAWILSVGRERASDDGEPQRTSGMPTLDVLRGAGLADVCCVVTRYFGGTLLGPGGLVRAYSTATQGAVDAARELGLVVEMTLVTPVSVHMPYALYDRVRDLAERSGSHERGSEFSSEVVLNLAFRAGEEAGFVAAVRELANGEDLCCVETPEFSEF